MIYTTPSVLALEAAVEYLQDPITGLDDRGDIFCAGFQAGVVSVLREVAARHEVTL